MELDPLSPAQLYSHQLDLVEQFQNSDNFKKLSQQVHSTGYFFFSRHTLHFSIHFFFLGHSQTQKTIGNQKIKIKRIKLKNH